MLLIQIEFSFKGHYDSKSTVTYSLQSKIDSNSSITYNMTYEIEDTLTFYECPHNPHRSAKEIVVSNQDNYIYHSLEDATIRFFSVNKLGSQGKSDCSERTEKKALS